MKEFLKSNTVTHNLMSFTAFKSMIIFTLLLESPKSYAELKEVLRNHEYLHEEVSTDTLRIYINSLRKVGCNVEKITENGITKHVIKSHPFRPNFNKDQVNSIIKVYKAISKTIDFDDLISLQNFFDKISNHVDNTELKEKLNNLSPIGNINPKLLQDLRLYAKNKTEITIYYNSPHSGRKNITILSDKISVENSKLYFYGYNTEYKNYSKFLVTKIIKIVSVNLNKNNTQQSEIVVGYQYTKDNEDFTLLDNEKLISKVENKLTIEISSKNKFEIMQRIMFLSSKCKVLYPENFKAEIVATLKKMKESYND